MKLYIDYLKLNFKTVLQYRLSFILSLIAQIFVFFTYYFMIISLFQKFSNLQGYNIYEILLTFSIIHFGYSMNETFARGIDQFDNLIIDGSFDRLLLRPKNILLQVVGYQIDYTKFARVFQSIIIMIIALIKLDINWSILKVLTLTLMLISSIAIFFGIFLLAASYCFLTVQGLEVRNLFTDGGKHAAQYPIGIFNKYFVKVFTFIIPYALVNYYPLQYFVGKTDNIYFAFLPLIVFIYLIPCFLIFNKGSKNYLSTGS
ncbi:MAG: ABC-2 family transporter protein [Bacilli bacterium]|nr:ABC-2 family transporter protein [Bacilli bacterium]